MPTSRRQQIQRLILPAVAGGCLIFAISAVTSATDTQQSPVASPQRLQWLTSADITLSRE